MIAMPVHPCGDFDQEQVKALREDAMQREGRKLFEPTAKERAERQRRADALDFELGDHLPNGKIVHRVEFQRMTGEQRHLAVEKRLLRNRLAQEQATLGLWPFEK